MGRRMTCPPTAFRSKWRVPLSRKLQPLGLFITELFKQPFLQSTDLGLVKIAKTVLSKFPLRIMKGTRNIGLHRQQNKGKLKIGYHPDKH